MQVVFVLLLKEIPTVNRMVHGSLNFKMSSMRKRRVCFPIAAFNNAVSSHIQSIKTGYIRCNKGLGLKTQAGQTPIGRKKNHTKQISTSRTKKTFKSFTPFPFPRFPSQFPWFYFSPSSFCLRFLVAYYKGSRQWYIAF